MMLYYLVLDLLRARLPDSAAGHPAAAGQGRTWRRVRRRQQPVGVRRARRRDGAVEGHGDSGGAVHGGRAGPVGNRPARPGLAAQRHSGAGTRSSASIRTRNTRGDDDGTGGSNAASKHDPAGRNTTGDPSGDAATGAAAQVRYTARPPSHAEVAEWQTHQLEGLAGATPWRFESSLPHHSTRPRLSPRPRSWQAESFVTEGFAHRACLSRAVSAHEPQSNLGMSLSDRTSSASLQCSVPSRRATGLDSCSDAQRTLCPPRVIGTRCAPNVRSEVSARIEAVLKRSDGKANERGPAEAGHYARGSPAIESPHDALDAGARGDDRALHAIGSRPPFHLRHLRPQPPGDARRHGCRVPADQSPPVSLHRRRRRLRHRAALAPRDGQPHRAGRYRRHRHYVQVR